jgi:hypothetical protein
MPTGPDLDFFKSFSSTDLADLGDAMKADPSLMQAPELSTRDKIARRFNEATRALGLVFGNQDALKVSAMREQQFKQEEQSAMLGRLLPALGAAQAKRADAEAAAKAEAKQEAKAARQMALAEHAMKNMRLLNGKPLSQDNVREYVTKNSDFYENPGGEIPRFSFEAKPWTDEDKSALSEQRQMNLQNDAQAAADARQEKSLGAADERQRKGLEASDERQRKALEASEKRLNDRADAAEKKASALKDTDIEKHLSVALGVTGDATRPGKRNIRDAIESAKTPEALASIEATIKATAAKHGGNMDEKAKALLVEMLDRVKVKKVAAKAGPLNMLRGVAK